MMGPRASVTRIGRFPLVHTKVRAVKMTMGNDSDTGGLASLDDDLPVASDWFAFSQSCMLLH